MNSETLHPYGPLGLPLHSDGSIPLGPHKPMPHSAYAIWLGDGTYGVGVVRAVSNTKRKSASRSLVFGYALRSANPIALIKMLADIDASMPAFVMMTSDLCIRSGAWPLLAAMPLSEPSVFPCVSSDVPDKYYVMPIIQESISEDIDKRKRVKDVRIANKFAHSGTCSASYFELHLRWSIENHWCGRKPFPGMPCEPINLDSWEIVQALLEEK